MHNNCWSALEQPAGRLGRSRVAASGELLVALEGAEVCEQRVIDEREVRRRLDQRRALHSQEARRLEDVHEALGAQTLHRHGQRDEHSGPPAARRAVHANRAVESELFARLVHLHSCICDFTS